MGAEVGLAGPPTVNLFALEYRIRASSSHGEDGVLSMSIFFSDALTYGRGLANPAGSQD